MTDPAVGGSPEPSFSESGIISVGAKLAAARQALDLSVADVARQIKLSVPQVEALEADDLSRLPKSPMIVKGFLRNYAKLVQLDPDALLGGTQPAPRPSGRGAGSARTLEAPLDGQSRPWGRPLTAWLLAIAAVLLAFSVYINQDLLSLLGMTDETEPAPTASPRASKQAETAAPVTASKTPAVTQDATPPVSPAFAPAAEPLPVPVTGATLRAGGADVPPTAAAASGQGIVRLTFARESWVEIKDRDGHRIFSQSNRAGTEQSVQGIPPLQLVIGNASGVKVVWNDQPVDLAPYTAKADIARFTLE